MANNNYLIDKIKSVRDYIYFTNRYTSILIDYLNIRIRKSKENSTLEEIKNAGGKIYESKELINILKKKNDKICHIVGLGWSLNNSIKSIDNDKSFIIGMNEGAISALKFDLYLMEPGDGSVSRTKRQTLLIDDLINKDDTLVLMKNVYLCKEKGIDYFKENYISRLSFIKNLGIVCGNNRNIMHWSRKLLKYNSNYIIQFKSTVITAIAIAKNAGFRTIILHGVDFGGKYFYEDQKYVKYAKYTPSTSSRYNHFIKDNKSLIHPTSGKKQGMERILVDLKKMLENDGVKLFSATRTSPLSNFLNVYEE